MSTSPKSKKITKATIWLASTIAVAFVLLLQNSARADNAPKRTLGLPRSSPEAQGIASSAILAFVEEADQKIDHLHSFMLVRHGHVVAEGWWNPYDAGTRHELYSLSKSFTSTAVGLAIADGKLSLDDPVLKFFPDEAPKEPSANLKAMRVRDLLCMSTGHQTEPRLNPFLPSPTEAPKQQPQTWVKTFLAHPVPFKPGTHFLYNTAATYMQSAIVQKVTGQTVLDYLRPQLFDPLGIENPTWGTSPQGITLGGYGLNIRTEDIAKFGQLYLQRGQWNGRQLVPAAWVEAATSRQTSNGSNPASDWDQGYGYQFWRARQGAYRGDGAFGQYCIVMPEQDAVVAITSGVRDMQAVLNLVWDKLLPAMKHDPLPPDSEGDRKLQAKLASLTMPAQKGSASVHIPQDISGKRFAFPASNQKVEMLGLELGAELDTVTLFGKFNGGAEQKLSCGYGGWKKGRLAFGTFPERPAAACGAWTADHTYTAKICFYETPFVLTMNLHFADGKLQFDPTWNVAFGPTKPGQLIGELKKTEDRGSKIEDRQQEDRLLPGTNRASSKRDPRSSILNPQSSGAGETALDRYVAKPDPTYSWKVAKEIPGNSMVQYILDLKSQTWRTAHDVDRTVWQHWLIIIKPDKVTPDTAFLYITGGRNGSEPPKSADPLVLQIAEATHSVVAELRMVPNQPLVFHNDGVPRKEDDLIGYTWDQYLKTGDDTWPARLPMTKSAVRAMDCIQEFMAGEPPSPRPLPPGERGRGEGARGGKHKIDKFVVAGASKRGWTTWCTAAVDKRVVAAIPIVIDVVNVRPSMQHHVAAYGFYVESVGDYVRHQIVQRSHDPRLADLYAIEDPYSYRDRLTMPKFIVNSSGDQFFCPDSSQFYYNDLKGEKYLRYVPNTDHSLKGSDATESIIAFYWTVLTGKPRPRYSWTFEKNGSIRVMTPDHPKEVVLWQANNPTARDFRLEKIGQAYTRSPLREQGDGVYVAKLETPAKGWTASFVELTFDVGAPAPLKLSTAVRVLPDRLPFTDLDPAKAPYEPFKDAAK